MAANDNEPGLPKDNEPVLAEDMMRGAAAIAKFMGCSRRHIYYLVESKKGFPWFTECRSSTICARKSVLLHWIKQQEERHANDNCIPSCANKRSA